MKKALYSLMIFASTMIFAQKNPNVKFAICNDIVGTVAMFDAQKQFVQSVTTYNTKTNLPQNLKKFSFLASPSNTLAAAKFKSNFDTLDNISLQSLATEMKLAADAPVFIDGYEFPDTSVKIYADLIKEMKIAEVNGKKSLVITSVTK